MALIERIIQPLLKAQHQAGVQEGIQKGIDQGIQKGIDEGIQKGIDEGFKRGKQRSDEAYQEWIRQQTAAGAQFRDDIPPPRP